MDWMPFSFVVITPATCDSGDGPGLFLHFNTQILHLSLSSVYDPICYPSPSPPPSYSQPSPLPWLWRSSLLPISCQRCSFQAFPLSSITFMHLFHSLWWECLHFSPSPWFHKYGWAFSSYLLETLNKSKMLQINARY